VSHYDILLGVTICCVPWNTDAIALSLLLAFLPKLGLKLGYLISNLRCGGLVAPPPPQRLLNVLRARFAICDVNMLQLFKNRFEVMNRPNPLSDLMLSVKL